eukprot:TRINITY_DN15977_c0_g1_i1.p1 TRINITY_DN15977_c0_g1~~TRINITY_DN15977_c0_g1_i1.p1  ORF type:complete len:516 (-),score=33.61 TRINITY_DN15977_c0_g1_i1:110-1468(-)
MGYCAILVSFILFDSVHATRLIKDRDKEEACKLENCPKAIRYSQVFWPGVFALIGCCIVVASLVIVGELESRYIADYVLGAVFVALCSIVCVCIAFQFSRTTIAPSNSAHGKCWVGCCSLCWLPFLVLLASLMLYNLCMKASDLTSYDPPGVLVSVVPDELDIHVYCNGEYNESRPTILFLHGFLGSSLDVDRLRRHPDILATGLRFCSLDRPGYGWSSSWPSSMEPHMGNVAQITQSALAALGISGDMILVFHSLGGYWALALAKLLQSDSTRTILGGVAIDALVPRWKNWKEERQMSACNKEHSPVGGSFWKLVKTMEPTGLVRLLYVSNFAGYKELINIMHPDVQGPYFANAMSPKYFDVVITENERWEINCGWAIEGEAAMGEWKRLEVIVVPNGVNNSHFADLNTASNVDIQMGGPPGNEHSGIIFHPLHSQTIAAALLRVINDTVI